MTPSKDAMENFKALNFLWKIEKTLNIHRDYLILSRRKRVFITFMIIMEIIISVFICTNYFSLIKVAYKSQPTKYYISIIFNLLYTLQSFVLTLYLAPRFGKEFRSLLSNLANCHDIIKCNLQHQKFLSELKFKCILIIFIFTVLRIILTISAICITVHEYKYSYEVSLLSLIVYFAADTWLEARFMIELLIFYCLLAIIRNLLQTLIVLLKDVDSGSLGHNLNVIAKVYRLLLDSVRQLKKPFNRQILLMLFIAGTHNTFIIYRVINELLTDTRLWIFRRPNIFWRTLMYCTLYATVAKSGQDVRNEVSNLIQTLAKIGVKYATDEAYADQGLKDLQRLFSVQPLTIELLPTLPVGMYLLPAILSLAVNYVIVTLQMNHDI